ncbi:Amino acid permease 2 [Platanthera guangdongensis]|uniref:Amino acid permease 2 n=1 Tax=Platanthera guangdongensis TaxID=2320717 RepID=A0ABR2MKA1_9ASPA
MGQKACEISCLSSTMLNGGGAYDDEPPENLLTGFGFHNTFWLHNIPNSAIVIHLVGAYQI